MTSKSKMKNKTFMRMSHIFQIVLYHLFSFCLLTLSSSQVFCELTLDKNNGKRLVEQLKVERLRLQEALQALLPLQEGQANHTSNDDTKQLYRIEKLVGSIQEKAMMYFQAQRSIQISTKLTLQLRDQIWSLLDYRNKLFQRVKGCFCLRPEWERTMAKIYLNHQKKQRAISHFLRAYNCGGENKDLEIAKQIKDSIALNPPK